MSTPDTTALPDYAPVPQSAIGPTLNEQGYYVGRVERNLYWVTDGVYQAAFLTTPDGVVLFDAPPTIGGNLQRAVDEIAAANGVTNRVTHLVYSHHHDALMMIDVVNAGWVPIYNLNLSEDVPGHMAAPATALDYPWTHFICGHLGRLATREDVAVHQAYIADIEASAEEALATVDPMPFLLHYGENIWAGVQGYLDAVTDAAAKPVIAKYTGVLAAADIEVFTRTTTFAIMQSLRLDSGPSGPVHP